MDTSSLAGVASAMVLIPLCLFWLAFGLFFTTRETPVDKPNRVAQFYGYTVCLISLILVLTSISGILDSVFQRSNPLQSGDYPFGGSLGSFEAYKARRGKDLVTKGLLLVIGLGLFGFHWQWVHKVNGSAATAVA